MYLFREEHWVKLFMGEQEGYLVSQGVHVVFKPFDIDHLMANVKQLLDTHEHSSSQAKEEMRRKKE